MRIKDDAETCHRPEPELQLPCSTTDTGPQGFSRREGEVPEGQRIPTQRKRCRTHEPAIVAKQIPATASIKKLKYKQDYWSRIRDFVVDHAKTSISNATEHTSTFAEEAVQRRCGATSNRKS